MSNGSDDEETTPTKGNKRKKRGGSDDEDDDDEYCGEDDDDDGISGTRYFSSRFHGIGYFANKKKKKEPAIKGKPIISKDSDESENDDDEDEKTLLPNHRAKTNLLNNSFDSNALINYNKTIFFFNS